MPRIGANRVRNAAIVLARICFSQRRSCAATLSLAVFFCGFDIHDTYVRFYNMAQEKTTDSMALRQDLYEDLKYRSSQLAWRLVYK